MGCFCKCEEFKLVYKLEKSQNQLENLPSFLQSNWRKWRSLRALKNCEDRRRAAEGVWCCQQGQFLMAVQRRMERCRFVARESKGYSTNTAETFAPTAGIGSRLVVLLHMIYG